MVIRKLNFVYAVLIGWFFQGCSEPDTYECLADYNNHLQIQVEGGVSDEGFRDVLYQRSIKLIDEKEVDSLSFDLGESEYVEFYVKPETIILDSIVHSSLLFYNLDNPIFVAVDLENFEILPNRSVKEAIGGSPSLSDTNNRKAFGDCGWK